MTIKTSTGLREHLAVTGSVKNALDGGLIKFYNGAIPATADDAATGDNLWVVAVGGNAPAFQGATVLSTKDDISADTLGLDTAKKLGAHVAEMALRLATSKA